MSKHDGCYVKIANNVTFWAVDKGKRRIVSDMKGVYEIGLRPIHVISEPELDKIPLAGAPPKASKDKKE